MGEWNELQTSSPATSRSLQACSTVTGASFIDSPEHSVPDENIATNIQF